MKGNGVSDLLSRKSFHIWHLLFQIAGICCFLLGFIPWSMKDNSRSSRLNLPSSIAGFVLNSSSLYTPSVDQIMWIVIDAWGADFLDEKAVMMPYLQNKREKGLACVFSAQAHSPTVTLPRIKALVTGSIPGFGDTFLNLVNADNALQEDNILQQSKALRLNLIFFGDETWVKLFPNAFQRSEGLPSFFVQDYTEIDLKVTRQLDVELEKNDWNIAILHYLGLDHIGHLSGPTSPLIRIKLQEMDEVISKVHKRLTLQGDKSSAIFVCGDHGMSKEGSHGGSSLSETTVPLVFLLPQPIECSDSSEALQIDAVASLCFLLGLPLPRHSLGVPLRPILRLKSPPERLYSLYYLSTHLNDVYERQTGQSVPRNGKNEFDEAVNLYVRLLKSQTFSNEILTKEVEDLFLIWARKLQSILSSQSTRKSVPLVLFGIGLVFLAFTLAAVCLRLRVKILEWPILAGPCLQGLSLGSSSFVEEEHQCWYWIQGTLCGIALIISVRKYCKSHHSTYIMLSIFALILQRVLRSWVRTGDKWAQEPDVEDVLRENQIMLSLSSVMGLTVVCVRVQVKQKWHRFLVILAVFGSYLYRGAIGSTMLPSFYPSSAGFWEAHITYVSIGLLTLFRSTKKSSVWLLLVMLLLKPHLHFPLALLHIHIEVYHHVLQLLTSNCFVKGVAFWCLAKASYFYMGYCNSLSRLDVSSGYVGLTNYYPVIVGCLLACATYGGTVLVLISGLEVISSQGRNMYVQGVALACLWPSTVYLPLLWFLQDHLFIWSVFCPKLLFLLAETVLVFVVAIISAKTVNY